MNYCKQYARFSGIPEDHAHMYHALQYGNIKRSFNNMEDLIKYVSHTKDALSVYIPYDQTDPYEDYDLEEYNPLSMDDKIYCRKENTPISIHQHKEISAPLDKYNEYLSKIKLITITVFNAIIDSIDYFLFED
jgi:hypothetical protein